WGRVQAFASGLARLGLAKPGAMIGISGYPTIDAVVADLSCLHLAAVSVPLSTIAAADELGRVVTGAGVSCIACDVQHLEVLGQMLGSATGVRALVVTGVREQDRAQAEALARGQERIAEAH